MLTSGSPIELASREPAASVEEGSAAELLEATLVGCVDGGTIAI
jgi:hypothetical protein